jgi:hypothetical protein
MGEVFSSIAIKPSQSPAKVEGILSLLNPVEAQFRARLKCKEFSKGMSDNQHGPLASSVNMLERVLAELDETSDELQVILLTNGNILLIPRDEQDYVKTIERIAKKLGVKEMKRPIAARKAPIPLFILETAYPREDRVVSVKRKDGSEIWVSVDGQDYEGFVKRKRGAEMRIKPREVPVSKTSGSLRLYLLAKRDKPAQQEGKPAEESATTE